MAAHPTPPQTPTTTTPTPSPTLTAVQARALLQTLLSTRSNPPAPRTSSNITTPNNASKPSSPPTKNQPPSSHQTITIDASTRIMGHANTISLPANNVLQTGGLEEIMRAALSSHNMKPTTNQSSARPINITIQTGITLMGSRNIVVFGSGSATKDSVKLQQGARNGMDTGRAEGTGGRKRRAESEPVVEARGGKKVKVEKE